MTRAIRLFVTIALAGMFASSSLAQDQPAADDPIDPSEPFIEDQALPVPDAALEPSEDLTPFEVGVSATEIRPKIEVPAYDPWQATLAELEPPQQQKFERLFRKLTPAEQAGFLGVSAWMRLGHRGILVDLLLRSNRAEQDGTFAFFASLNPAQQHTMASLFDRQYGRYREHRWESLPRYLAVAPPEEARIVIFGPALKAVCGISPDPEENLGSELQSETAPYDPACHARVKLLGSSWVYTGRYAKGARFLTATTITAPWQAALHRDGESARLRRTPLAISKEWAELKTDLNDWERQHICGAVYIGGPWVLTAAHCVVGQPPGGFLANRVIRLGSIYLSRGAQLIPIDAVVHNNFSEADSYRDDIALLHLARAPRIGPMSGGGAQPAMLPLRGAARPGPTDNLTITGWGHREISDIGGIRSNRSGKLQRTSEVLGFGIFQPIDHDTCVKNRVVKEKHWTIHPGQICLGSRQAQDACRGDSGGPVVWKTARGPVLVGLVSYGKGCGVEGAPGIYTDVQYYVDNGWIDYAKAQARIGEFRMIRAPGRPRSAR